MERKLKYIIGILLAFCMLLTSCGSSRKETASTKEPSSIPETAEPNEENPLPEWLEKGEDGYCYLLVDKIDGINDRYDPGVFDYYAEYWEYSLGYEYVPFASLSEMQDVLLHSLPTYYYKDHFTQLIDVDYRLEFDPRNIALPVIPASLEYERVEVTAGARSYGVHWLVEDTGYWDDPHLYPDALMSMRFYMSTTFDDYYDDCFGKFIRSQDLVGHREIENGITADVYSVGEKTVLLYSVNENYHVMEVPNEDYAKIAIKMDDWVIICELYLGLSDLTREELWSFSVKPFVPEEDTTNKDVSDRLVQIREGMTYTEIKEILQDPGEPNTDLGYMHRCMWTLPNGHYLLVRFDKREISFSISYS